MQRITARSLLLAGVLIQGMHAVLAKQPMAVQAQLPSVLERKAGRPTSNPHTLKPAATNLAGNLSTLKAPNSLDLPRKSSEVKIRELRAVSLADVEQLVEVNSPQLKGMESQIQQAKAQLVAALSKWYPTINLSANGLPTYLTSESFRNPDFSGTEFNAETGRFESIPYSNGRQLTTGASVQIQWSVIDPSRIPAIAAARDNFEKAKDSYSITLRELRLEAASKYFLLQRADEGVRIGKQSMRASLVSLRDAKARYKAGVATKLEVLEAETQLARDKQLLTSRLGDQNISRRSLSSLLNLPQEITPIADSQAEVIGLWKPTLEESIIAAYQFREELSNLLLDISINNNNANVALAAGQPSLSFVNSFSASRYFGQTGISHLEDIDMSDYGWSVSNSVGLTANWKIFDGGRARALYRYNKYKAKEVEANFALQRNTIRQEVEESFFNLHTANQDIATTTREVIASRESLRLARLRFQAGVTTQREVVNNQRDLTQAEVRYSDAITSYNISLARLRRRTGIDHIKACQPSKLPSQKPEVNELIDVPLEPFPLKPACQASTMNSTK